MKIGSTAARISLVTSNEDAIEILAEAGLDSADFWLYLCSLDKSCPLCGDDWRHWTEKIKRKLDAVKLPVLQSHALFNIFVPEDFTYIPPQEIIYRNIEASAILECRKLVFHPVLLLQRMTTEAAHRKILEYNERWFRALLPAAEMHNVEIHIENTFDFAHVQQEQDRLYAFSTIEDICWLVDRLAHPLVKVCFDTGHASISGIKAPEAVRQIGDRLGSVHLQDNFGPISPIEPDVHLFPGHGTIDWCETIKALKEIGYRGVLNMEPVDSLPRLPRELMVHQLSSAAGFLKKLAVHCGLE